MYKALQHFPVWSYKPPFKKVKSQIVFRKFQQTGDQTGHWVWSVGNPSNPSLAAHIEGFPLSVLLSEKVVCASAFFSLTPIKPPFFWLGWTRLNGTMSPSYPEVPLDNFGFPVGGRLAARRAVFQPVGQSPIAILSTLYFGPKTGQRNLVGPSRPQKTRSSSACHVGPLALRRRINFASIIWVDTF